jgi:sugar/nucleoside kinase (ribokinase family)
VDGDGFLKAAQYFYAILLAMPDVVCLGVLVTDIVAAPMDTLPLRGTLELIDRLEMHIGGNAANTADALAKLGVSVGLLAGVGADSFGEYMVTALGSHGVEMAGVVKMPEVGTAASLVTVHSDAQRSFLHVPGANAAYGAEDVNWDATTGAKLFHVAGLQLMRRLEGDAIAQILAEARRRGMTTVLDTVMNPKSLGWAGLAPALPHLDWFIPSMDEARWLVGEAEPDAMVAKLRKHGATNLALKHGAGGCMLYPHEGAAIVLPVFPVTAVDTLGAGDSWAAGFLTGLLHGMPLEQAGTLANAVGACCVEAFGATTGILPLDATCHRFGV